MYHRYPLDVTKRIGVKEWSRFEDLADDKEDLWTIFKDICEDKKTLIEKEMCGFDYFQNYVMPHLETPIKSFLDENKLAKNDIEIIISLYLKLLPKNECKTCGSYECLIQKMNKHLQDKQQ